MGAGGSVEGNGWSGRVRVRRTPVGGQPCSSVGSPPGRMPPSVVEPEDQDGLDEGDPPAAGWRVGFVPALPVGLLEAVLLGEALEEARSLGPGLVDELGVLADGEGEGDRLGAVVADEPLDPVGREDALGADDALAAAPVPALAPPEAPVPLECESDAPGAVAGADTEGATVCCSTGATVPPVLGDSATSTAAVAVSAANPPISPDSMPRRRRRREASVRSSTSSSGTNAKPPVPSGAAAAGPEPVGT